MLQFTVTPPGREQFAVTIHPDTRHIETNLLSEAVLSDPKMCNKCQESKVHNSCNLLRAVVPVLLYFSDLLSYEEVTVTYAEDAYTATFTVPAQRAGFILCLYTMFHSTCDYFSQFRFLLPYYRVNITYEIFMHMILTTFLLKRQTEGVLDADQGDIFAEVKAMATEFRDRLSYILEDARSIEKKDAAINALNIIFSLNSLSADYLWEFQRNFHRLLQGLKS